VKIYLGLLRNTDAFPIERFVASTEAHARRQIERAIEAWLDWKPGLNTYQVASPGWPMKTAFFRWIDHPHPSEGGSYGDYPPEWTFETLIEPPRSDEDENDRTLAITYALILDEEFEDFRKETEEMS